MFAGGLNVEGQGVASAFLEQEELVNEIDKFDIYVNEKKKKDFDICHFHTINPSFFFKYKKNRVNVCSVHFIPEFDDGSLKMPKFAFNVYRSYTLKFYRKADKLVVVNPYFIRPLVELGFKKENIKYIPNFVSRDKFYKYNDEKRKIIRKTYGFSEDDFIVLGVGQTQTRKGIVDFCKVAESMPDVKFVWAGGFTFKKITSGYEEIKKLIDNPPKNMKFLGIVPRETMNDVYNLADVLFLPSYQELFPMTLLECVNVEIPFVVRDLDLYKEIFLTDYIVGNNNEEFKEILNRLKEDPKFKEEGFKKSLAIASFYSKEHVKEMRKEYYSSLVDDKN